LSIPKPQEQTLEQEGVPVSKRIHLDSDNILDGQNLNQLLDHIPQEVVSLDTKHLVMAQVGEQILPEEPGNMQRRKASLKKLLDWELQLVLLEVQLWVLLVLWQPIVSTIDTTHTGR